jgi:hypothetical protein
MQCSTFLGGGVGYSVGNFRHKNLVSGEFWFWHPHAKIPKFIDISTCCRHVANMLPTFPAKIPILRLLSEDLHFYLFLLGSLPSFLPLASGKAVADVLVGLLAIRAVMKPPPDCHQRGYKQKTGPLWGRYCHCCVLSFFSEL